jgi:hypothetical protein
MLKAAEESLGDQLAARKEQADRIEAQAAEIEQLRRDHAAMVKEANIAKARLKGVQKQWYADRATLEDAK